MTIIFLQDGHMSSFTRLEQMVLTGGVAARLLVAAVLGGAIGLDREYHRKASGVRTNLLICFGCALFTFLSPIIAGESGSNKGQIASNIVQGIGFLGAGLILHNRNRISGLTSAATVFAVASIGMSCGAGLYFPAIFATALVILVLESIGLLEKRTELKQYSRVYEVRGQDAPAIEQAVLDAMDKEKRRLGDVERDRMGALERLSFTVIATHKGHHRLQNALQRAGAVSNVLSFHDWEDD